MNENQLQELYNKISSADATYSKRYTFDQFKANMQDQAYVGKLSGWASSRGINIPSAQQEPVQQKPVVNAYNAEELLKKNAFQSASSSEDSSSEQPTQGKFVPPSYKPEQPVSESTGLGTTMPKKQQQAYKVKQAEQKKMEQYPEFFRQQMKGVNTDLMSKEEEYVVPQLNYKFGPLGFKFEESGITNQITVTAPNGTKKDIPLNSNILEDITIGNIALKAANKALGYEEHLQEAAMNPTSELKKFIIENTVNTKELSKYEDMYKGQKAKYETDKQAQEALDSATKQYVDVNKKIKYYTELSTQADNELSQLNSVPFSQRDTEEYKNRYQAAIDKKQQALRNAPNLEQDRQAAALKYKQVEKATGDYFLMKGEQGSWLSGITNNALKATGSALAGAVDIGIKIGNPTYAYNYEMAMGREKLRDAITNHFIENYGDKSTTEQWEATRSKNTFGGAVLGLGSMIPAVAAGALTGGIGTAAVFASQGYNDATIEGRNAGIPEGERDLVAVPVGITMGVISELGLKDIPGINNFSNYVTKKALTSLGSDFTATTFRNYVQNEIESSVARGLLTAGEGFVHGFKTGVKMDLGTTTIKDIYNTVKAKKDEDGNYMKVFNTPESIAGNFAQAFEAGISMGIGGAIMSSKGAFASAFEKNNFNGISNKELELFDRLSKDDKYMQFVSVGLDHDVLNGKITEEQKQRQLQIYQQAAALMKSLPENLTDAQKRKSLGLLNEKSILENSIDGKDKSLTKKQRDRIAEIDEFLNNISEGKYSEILEMKPEEVIVEPGQKVQWHTEVTKPLEDWTVTEKTDDSVTLTKGEETQTIPLTELQQHLIDNNAVQKPTTDESVLRAKQPELGLQEVVEGDQEPEVTQTEEETTAEKTALEQATEARKAAKSQLESIKQGLGIDPEAKLRALVKYHKALVSEAKEFIKEKAGDFAEWAKTMGGELGTSLKKAWDEATEAIKPIENAEELGYEMEDIFGKTKEDEMSESDRRNMEEYKLSKLTEEVLRAQRNIGNSDNPEKAIKEWNEIKKKRDDFEAAMNKRKEDIQYNIDLENLIYDENERRQKEGEDYEYSDLYNKDPRLAALENAKRMLDFINSEDYVNNRRGRRSEQEIKEDIERGVKMYSEDIKVLERSLKDNPPKAEEKTTATPTTETTAAKPKQKKAPTAEELLGRVQKKTVQMTPAQAIKEQIRNMAKGAADNAKAVSEAIKQIVDYVKSTDMNRADLQKVMDILSDKKISNEEGLNKAIEKVFDIVDKSNKDIVEVSQKKIDKEKMKAEMKARKEGAESVVDKVKAIKEYFNQVKEYGNLTRKDLLKIMKEMSKVKDEKSLDKAVDKINDIIDKAKTDILEISEMKMIKEKLKAIKEAKKNLNEKRKLIAAAIDFIKKSGKINAKKVGEMLKKLGKVNLEDDVRIEKIIEYIENAFEDAQYDKKLGEANGVRGKIKRLIKSEKVLGNLKPIAEEFAKINPSMVEDIGKYNEMAEKLNEAMRGSNKDKIANAVSTQEVSEYTKEALENQNQKVMDEKSAMIQELFGFDPAGMTLEEMTEMLKKQNKGLTDEEKQEKRQQLKDVFDTYSSIIKDILRTGTDPITGETVDMDVSERVKSVAERFANMDIERMTDKEILEAIDVMTNFDTNFSHAKMEKIVSGYEQRLKMDKAIEKGLIADKLRSYFSGAIGRLKFGYRATIPELFVRLFKGTTRGIEGRSAIGLTSLINGITKAKYIANSIANEYVNEFYKNKEFNTLENSIERGMIAHLMRSESGSAEQVKKDFDKRRGIIKESIEALLNGSEKEREKGELYQKVWDKLGVGDANSYEELIKKANSENVRAVEWWIDKWAEHRQDMADVSEGIYNRVLEKDVNFTPDRYSRFDDGPVDLLKDDESAYHTNNGTLYNKSAGSLMEAERPSELPKEGDRATRYLDLSFDTVNSSAFYDAMVDVHTAAQIEAVKEAINSDSFKKMIKDEKDRRLVQTIIKDYVSRVRGKSIQERSEAEGTIRKLNKIADIGVTMALGSIAQPAKQTLSVGFNALLTGSIPQLYDMYHNGGIEFMMNSGMGIALRSKESQTSIRSVNKLIDLAAQSRGSKSIEFVAKANENLMKAFLENPDVWIARASWLGYYEKYLKDNGFEYNNINYKEHKLNQDAADYAQAMLDRQQNVSDRDLNGLMFQSKKPSVQLFMKALMPFSSFRLNQATRMSNDIATLNSKVATKEDRIIAARSLAGTSVEMGVFNLVGIGASFAIGTATKAVMGQDETDEEKEKRLNNLIKGRATGAVTDIFSPLPLTDAPVQDIAHNVIGFVEDTAGMSEEDKVNVFSSKPADYVKGLGLYGVPLERAENLYKVSKLYATGEFEDDYGRKKHITDDDRDAMGMMIGPAVLAAAGLVPTEVNTMIKQSINFAEKKSKVESKLTEQELKEKEENKKERKENLQEKRADILQLLQTEADPQVRKELKKMLKESNYPMDDVTKEKTKQYHKQMKKDEEDLLGEYETQSDMKRYAPDLYESRFGKYSEFYRKYNAREEAQKILNKYQKEQKDIEYNYTPPPKKQRLRFNSKLKLMFRRKGNQ